jgi:hypothetical protein
MIEVLGCVVDKESGNTVVTLRLPHPKEGFVRYHPDAIEQELDNQGVKRGKLLNPTVMCNKPGHPLAYVLVYATLSEKKEEKTVDKTEEKVILKKTRSRKPKTTGG